MFFICIGDGTPQESDNRTDIYGNCCHSKFADKTFRYCKSIVVRIVADHLLFQDGEITGAKAWFWIVGEINYPIVAVAYFLLDQVCERFGMKPNIIFLVSVVVIMICMPYYYKHYGFALGVTIEARYL